MKKILYLLVCIILVSALSISLISCNNSDKTEQITAISVGDFDYNIVKVFEKDGTTPIETYACVTKYKGNSTSTSIPSTITADNKEIPVTTVSGLVFEHTKIQSVVLCDNLTTISTFAFGYADDLRIVTFPSTLKKIGDYAFVECRNLTEVRIAATAPPSVGKYSFKIYNEKSKAEDQYEINPQLKIIIGAGLDKAAYIAANNGWSEYDSSLVG